MNRALLPREDLFLALIDTKLANGLGHTPVPTMVEALTPIWQRVLQLPSVGLDDNFFSLGGSLQLADVLFAEIEQVCRRDLPSATICHAPTIATLARLLEQPALPRFSPFVQVKPGREWPPILIAHGLGGLANFSKLANHIRTGHPIYGIQAKGVDGMEEPFDRIEDMAQSYLDALPDLQSQGPYLLIGYSFGGLVALEMAQRLSKEGKTVGLLAMVDSYPDPRYLTAGQRIRLIAQRARRHISEIGHKPVSEVVSNAVPGLKRRLHIPGSSGRDNRLPPRPRLSFEETTGYVKQKDYTALAHYQPKAYSGKIKFVKGVNDTYFPGDPAAVWTGWAPDFEVENVPGSHQNMVTDHFEDLAAVLTRYVKEALGL